MNLGRRIIVLGSSGSGKSTLSAKLGELTGIPVVHLDRLFWNPGWVETPKNEMDKKVADAVSGESWIIDGGYTQTLDFRLERADAIVFIDLGRHICLFRVFKRWIKNYGKTRNDMGEGCPEKVDIDFLKWVWSYPKRLRKITIEKIYSSGKQVYHLKSRKEVESFILECVRINGLLEFF